MFLEGYKRNWLYTEGYAFEDRMIDDLSVSLIARLRSLEYDYEPSSYSCLSESNGARGGR